MKKLNFKKFNLSKNDCVSLQSLSSGIRGDEDFLHRFNIGKDRVKKIKLLPLVSPNALKGSKYLEKNPKKRAEDLQDAIKDEKVKAIFANIGGFDSHKIIKYLDLEAIKNSPKPLLGFSDITSLHMLFYYLKIQTYYGPTILDGFAENVKMHSLTKKSLKKVLFTNKKQVIKSSRKWTSEYLEWTDKSNDFVKRKMNKEKYGLIAKDSNDIIEGHLLGGCIDTIYEIRKKFFFPKLEEWKNSIIFLETSEQKMNPTTFLKILVSLKKEISVCKGLIFGKPKDETYFKEYLYFLNRELKKPFFYNVNFGHCAPNITIPYGGNCKLDFSKKTITISK